MVDLAALKKSGDEEKLAAVLAEAVLPDPAGWMLASFGESVGAGMARRYSAHRQEVAPFLSKTLNQVLKEDLTEIEVIVSEGPDLRLEGQGSYARVTMRATRPITVFGARFRKKGNEQHWIAIWHFVYVDGAYRFVGLLRTECAETAALGPVPIADSGQPSDPTAPQRVFADGKTQHARIVRQVRPHYPLPAKQSGIKDTVRMRALIDNQGCVSQLEVLQGHPLLAKAAVEAVRGWVYEPAFFEGKPIQVVTLIDVVFTLQH